MMKSTSHADRILRVLSRAFIPIVYVYGTPEMIQHDPRIILQQRRSSWFDPKKNRIHSMIESVLSARRTPIVPRPALPVSRLPDDFDFFPAENVPSHVSPFASPVGQSYVEAARAADGETWFSLKSTRRYRITKDKERAIVNDTPQHILGAHGETLGRLFASTEPKYRGQYGISDFAVLLYSPELDVIEAYEAAADGSPVRDKLLESGTSLTVTDVPEARNTTSSISARKYRLTQRVEHILGTRSFHIGGSSSTKYSATASPTTKTAIRLFGRGTRSFSATTWDEMEAQVSAWLDQVAAIQNEKK